MKKLTMKVGNAPTSDMYKWAEKYIGEKIAVIEYYEGGCITDPSTHSGRDIIRCMERTHDIMHVVGVKCRDSLFTYGAGKLVFVCRLSRIPHSEYLYHVPISQYYGENKIEP